MNAASTPQPATETRVLDEALRRWVLKRSHCTELAEAAHAAIHAEGDGHACADLSTWPPEALAALRAQAWVGDGSTPSPFVLDAARRFYLWRNWRHETQLARALRKRAGRAFLEMAKQAALAADLTTLFAGTPAQATRRQREAVAAVVGTRLFVLTGGPGTGKTTTVLRMLLMLLRHASAAGGSLPSIALAAPTGKAAQRLAHAIAQGKAALRATLHDSGFAPLLQAIPHQQARTLHRLLGFDPRHDHFTHNARRPLPAEIVVVDEASMVDLALMRALTDALRPDALLILLGDPDQLASVDAGSVLADIVASTQIDDPAEANLAPDDDTASPAASTAPAPTSRDPALLHANAGRLTHVWRAQGGLPAWIEAIRIGDPELPRRLAAAADAALLLRPCADRAMLEVRLHDWIARHRDTFAQLLDPAIAPAQALRLLARMQLLCAVREGTFGMRGVNALLARQLAALGDVDTSREWYPGRPVIVTRNDYARGLFNGDVGIALRDGGSLRVWFADGGHDAGDTLRSYSPRALPAHDTAWAITIHRSQGSEYGEVAVLLPPDPAQRGLSRELLYTAVSRARDRAELWCGDDTLAAALGRHVQRLGGLRERLR